MGNHFCPKHYPLRRCRVCTRYMRPDVYGSETVEAYWPDTVTMGTQGRCHGCTLGMLEKIDLDGPDPDQAAVVLRLLRRHGALDIAPALGLG